MAEEKPDPRVAARLLLNAQSIKGGREALALDLLVSLDDLARWMSGKVLPPERVIERALELVLEAQERKSRSARRASLGGPVTALIADTPQGCAVIQAALGTEGLSFICVHTIGDARTVLGRCAVDVIVCGQHFDGSQMLHFLQMTKLDEGAREIPFICCRTLRTDLTEASLSAIQEACEALGVVAYIDLPERATVQDLEAAAIEFRDAVRGAVRTRRTGRLRIVVADDNIDAAHTLAALLQMSGHEVIKARNGLEALKAALSTRPDVVVLDLGMPKLTGYEVATRLRAEPWGGSVTLIAITGHGAKQSAERAFRSGFDHYLLKPVGYDQLMEALAGPVENDA